MILNTTTTGNERIDAASVLVHVIHGEHPAAMQYGNSSATSILIHSYFSRIGFTNLFMDSTSHTRYGRHLLPANSKMHITSTINLLLENPMWLYKLLNHQFNFIIISFSNRFTVAVLCWFIHYIIGNVQATNLLLSMPTTTTTTSRTRTTARTLTRTVVNS